MSCGPVGSRQPCIGCLYCWESNVQLYAGKTSLLGDITSLFTKHCCDISSIVHVDRGGNSYIKAYPATTSSIHTPLSLILPPTTTAAQPVYTHLLTLPDTPLHTPPPHTQQKKLNQAHQGCKGPKWNLKSPWNKSTTLPTPEPPQSVSALPLTFQHRHKDLNICLSELQLAHQPRSLLRQWAFKRRLMSHKAVQQHVQQQLPSISREGGGSGMRRCPAVAPRHVLHPSTPSVRPHR